MKIKFSIQLGKCNEKHNYLLWPIDYRTIIHSIEVCLSKQFSV